MSIDCPWQFREDMSIAKGTARVDYLVNNANNQKEIERVRQKIAKLLGLPIDKKWYLYMPTFRTGLDIQYSFSRPANGEYLNRVLLQNDAIIIEKQHPQVLRAHAVESGWYNRVFIVSSSQAELDIDVQELLLASDRLISDYSGCICDFAVLNRPILHYAYDYQKYRIQERSRVADLDKCGAGPVAKEEQEIVFFLSKSDNELLRMRSKDFAEFISGEKGNACVSLAKYAGVI